eukprot:1145508-Amphidinium_carterae.2
MFEQCKGVRSETRKCNSGLLLGLRSGYTQPSQTRYHIAAHFMPANKSRRWLELRAFCDTVHGHQRHH